MRKNISFACICLFWVVMNALLWRSEMGQTGETGNSIPAPVVWQKILTAPDDSGLEIFQSGKKVGYCRWRANVGEELSAGKIASENIEIEGMVKRLTGYTISLEGNFLLPDAGGRFRFDALGSFSTDHQWRDFVLRGILRPVLWELRAAAGARTVQFKMEDGQSNWSKSYGYADFQQPEKLLAEVGIPVFPGMLNMLLPVHAREQLTLGLVWTAREDWLKIGHAQARVYRLQTSILDRYKATILVSRVGEILKVELPGEIVLMNDALVNI